MEAKTSRMAAKKDQVDEAYWGRINTIHPSLLIPGVPRQPLPFLQQLWDTHFVCRRKGILRVFGERLVFLHGVLKRGWGYPWPEGIICGLILGATPVELGWRTTKLRDRDSSLDDLMIILTQRECKFGLHACRFWGWVVGRDTCLLGKMRAIQTEKHTRRGIQLSSSISAHLVLVNAGTLRADWVSFTPSHRTAELADE
ncbi:hypothetical protein VTK73DRAFT_3285 [Phialemonium thermophilum]|uniref:Uncharacterized protein n=1 Tax=Phialemonium thermophilum TaxID=223376 RepID=A0ABR3Y7M2_9PEZI